MKASRIPIDELKLVAWVHYLANKSQIRTYVMVDGVPRHGLTLAEVMGAQLG